MPEVIERGDGEPARQLLRHNDDGQDRYSDGGEESSETRN